MPRAESDADVFEFLEQYRRAFDRLDPDSIAALYSTPSGLVSGRSYVHWPDRESIARDPVRFRTAYDLVRGRDGLRVLLCTAYEEEGGGWGGGAPDSAPRRDPKP